MLNLAIGSTITVLFLMCTSLAYTWSFSTLPVGGYVPFVAVSLAPLISFVLGYLCRGEQSC